MLGNLGLPLRQGVRRDRQVSLGSQRPGGRRGAGRELRAAGIVGGRVAEDAPELRRGQLAAGAAVAVNGLWPCRWPESASMWSLAVIARPC